MPEESTTPDLRELAFQMMEARNRGDLDAYMSHFAPDAVWQTRYGERLEGTAAIRRFHEEFTGTFDELSSELLEFVDVGGGATFLVVRQGGRPGGSASELHEHVAFAAVVVDGLIQSMATYSDRDDARAAAERLAQELRQALSEKSTKSDLADLERGFVEAAKQGGSTGCSRSAPHAPCGTWVRPASSWDRRFAAFCAEWADPEIEYVIADGPEPGTFRGLAGLVEVMRTLVTGIEDFRAEAEEYRELDAEHVVVLTRGSGRGKLSGAPVSSRWAEVFEVHDGKVTRILSYIDRNRALADLGLGGQAVRWGMAR